MRGVLSERGEQPTQSYVNAVLTFGKQTKISREPFEHFPGAIKTKIKRSKRFVAPIIVTMSLGCLASLPTGKIVRIAIAAETVIGDLMFMAVVAGVVRSSWIFHTFDASESVKREHGSRSQLHRVTFISHPDYLVGTSLAFHQFFL